VVGYNLATLVAYARTVLWEKKRTTYLGLFSADPDTAIPACRAERLVLMDTLGQPQ
jgi:hypothetical protein